VSSVRQGTDDFYRGRRVCVTGGAGFIGSHVCEALVKHGALVSVIDDLSNGRRENLASVFEEVRFGQGSILDGRALREAMRGSEIVFHLAAIASVPRSVKEPVAYFEVNARGTIEVLEAARAAGVKRVVYAASSSAYGDSTELPKRESMSPMPLSPYASAKFAGEHFLRTYCACYGLSGISLRYFNIFGPRQRPDSPYAAVIPRFAEAMLNDRKPVIFGDGKQTRDFTYVENAVSANLLAGASRKPLHGEVVNIACGESFSLLQLVKAMAKHLNVRADVEFAPPRVGEVLHSCASIGAARELIGYKPLVKFDEGLKRTLDEFVRAATTIEQGATASDRRESAVRPSTRAR
jgi:UDP-glucose 4-epimerase